MAMHYVFRFLPRRLFGISTRETSFERRGFTGGEDGVSERLEQIGVAFVNGYHAALEGDIGGTLESKLRQAGDELSGFAFEGAAMGLALLDCLTPWKRDRIDRFLAGAGNAHAYMVHVGIGWAWARLPVNPMRAIPRLDPLLRWLVLDGFGFHEGYFRWRRYIKGQSRPRKIYGYGLRAFDQGFGRCLWFIRGGDVEEIAQTIAGFSKPRQGDLWSGVGLACVYAGYASEDQLQSLVRLAKPHTPKLAQGAAFAAKARDRAGNATHYTEKAVQLLCGMSPISAARLTDQMLANLPLDGAEPAYEVWRQRIQNAFQGRRQDQAFALEKRGVS